GRAFFFFQAEDGIRAFHVTGVQTCALPICASLMLDLLGFAEKARGARLVVTGEGELDTRSLRGTVPIGVARAAARAGAPVVAVEIGRASCRGRGERSVGAGH